MHSITRLMRSAIALLFIFACSEKVGAALDPTAASPLFTVYPQETLPTTILPGEEVKAIYRVRNNSSIAHYNTGVYRMPAGVSVTGGNCGANGSFRLEPGQSCIFELTIKNPVEDGHFYICYNGNVACTGVGPEDILNVAGLSSLNITPLNASIAAGSTQLFTASGVFTNGNRAELNSKVSWDSSNPQAVTINSNGLATGIAAGISKISAKIGDFISNIAELTVGSNPNNGNTGGNNGGSNNPPPPPPPPPATGLKKITISANSPGVFEGAAPTHLVAMGQYNDGSSADISDSVTWASSNPNAVVINSQGNAAYVAEGATKISATKNNVKGNTINLNSYPILSLSLPSSVYLKYNSKETFYGSKQTIATGHYSLREVTADVTHYVNWSSDQGAVAVVNSDGLVTATGTGTANITVNLGNDIKSQPMLVTSVPMFAYVTNKANHSITSCPILNSGQFGTCVLNAVNQIAATSVGISSDGLALYYSDGTNAGQCNINGDGSLSACKQLSPTFNSVKSIVATQDYVFFLGKPRLYFCPVTSGSVNTCTEGTLNTAYSAASLEPSKEYFVYDNVPTPMNAMFNYSYGDSRIRITYWGLGSGSLHTTPIIASKTPFYSSVGSNDINFGSSSFLYVVDANNGFVEICPLDGTSQSPNCVIQQQKDVFSSPYAIGLG